MAALWVSSNRAGTLLPAMPSGRQRHSRQSHSHGSSAPGDVISDIDASSSSSVNGTASVSELSGALTANSIRSLPNRNRNMKMGRKVERTTSGGGTFSAATQGHQSISTGVSSQLPPASTAPALGCLLGMALEVETLGKNTEGLGYTAPSASGKCATLPTGGLANVRNEHDLWPGNNTDHCESVSVCSEGSRRSKWPDIPIGHGMGIGALSSPSFSALPMPMPAPAPIPAPALAAMKAPYSGAPDVRCSG